MPGRLVCGPVAERARTTRSCISESRRRIVLADPGDCKRTPRRLRENGVLGMGLASESVESLPVESLPVERLVLQFPGDAAGIFLGNPIVAGLDIVEHRGLHRRSWMA